MVWKERCEEDYPYGKGNIFPKVKDLTLICSTLSNLPIYLIFLFQIPRLMILRLERIEKDFIWVGGILEKRTHVVIWSIVCSNK